MFKTELAYENWKSKYQYGDEEPIETFQRVARALASVEKNNKNVWYEKFLNTLVKFNPLTAEPSGLKCTTGGRITANVGTGYKRATPINCFSGETEYLDTNKGIVKFKDMAGKKSTVLTKNGPIEAVIKNFGYQKTLEYTFKPAFPQECYRDEKGRLVNKNSPYSSYNIAYRVNSRSSFSIKVNSTENHRWILQGDKQTTDLRIGDVVESLTYINKGINKDKYKEGFIHGIIFGDGSISYDYTDAPNSSGRYGYTRYNVRLYGSKISLIDWFNQNYIRYLPSNDGEPTCFYTSKTNLKEIPNGYDPDYIKGFIEGLIATDGCDIHKNKKSWEISTSLNEVAEWVIKNAFIAGYMVTGYHIDSNIETNYGKRKNPNRRIILSQEDIKWKVVGIQDNTDRYEEVFCAVVPDQASFTLSNGLYTGNCFIGGPVSGAEVKYRRKSADGEISFPVKYTTDDNPDDLVNIFLTIMEQAKTLASEGGYGLNFDWIRPRGSLIKGTGIRHPGIVSYMKVWNAVSECIVKGTEDGYVDKLKNYLKSEEKAKELLDAVKKSIRKGAMMGVVSCSHPDVEEVIRAKMEAGVLTKFNISILLDDKFMHAVENDDLYDQHFDGIVYKKIRAKDLYNLIMESCYQRAEPGVLFLDNMQLNNPVSYLGVSRSVNPCVRTGTLVATKNGLKPVEEVKKGDLIQTLLGFEPVDNIEVNENIDIYRISFTNGSYIDVTMGHIFHSQVGNAESRKKWKDNKRLEELLPGNFVRTDYYRFTPSSDYRFNRDDGFFAGLYLGDGHIDANKKVCISVDKRYDFPYITELCKRKGWAYWHDDSPDENSRKIVIGGEADNKSVDLLEKMGINLSYKAPDKTFPLWWLNSNEEFLNGLIDGLICSDGNVNNKGKYPQIRFKSCSKKLHEMIRQLMLIYGADYKIYMSGKAGELSYINGRKIERKHNAYEGILDNESILNIYRKIGGISNKEKNTILQDIISTVSLTGLKWKARIKSIDLIGKDTAYDLHVSPSDNWNTAGFISRGCGEVPGIPELTTICLLGSLNLTQYIYIDESGAPQFNYDEFSEDVRVLTRMLDNVNDLAYIPLPSYNWVMKNLRQIGIGLNGLGSALMMLFIPYNSKEALSFTEKVCSLKENLAWQTSALLAKEKGVFKAYNKEKFENTKFFNSNRITKDTKKLIRKYGVRNAKTTTNPPLGNSSILCDNISNGIEPVFSLEFERTIMCKEWPKGVTKENVKSVLKHYNAKDFEYWRGDYNGGTYYYEEHNRGLCEVQKVRDYGYQWLLDNFPDKDHSKYIVTTKDIDAYDHVEIQSIVQYYNSQSVSKTCNLPKNYAFKKFKDLYMQAWKKKLIGFTVYREGSMESVLSDISKAEKNKNIIKRDIILPDEFLNGPTKIIKKEGKKFYLNFSYLPEDPDMTFPVVLWIYSNAKYKEDLWICNKAAREQAKLAYRCGLDAKIIEDAVEKAKVDYAHNRLGRMISLNLRHNVPREDILVALAGIEGDNISSLLTAVRKFIGETIKDGTKLRGLKCESCGGEEMYMEGGCRRCKKCRTQACG